MKTIKPITLLMTDLETTGVDPEVTEILEMASVAINFDGLKMKPIDHFHEYIFTKTKPNIKDEFVMKYQQGLYKKCNELNPALNLENAQNKFKAFVNKHYPNQNLTDINSLPQFTGQNFSAFDAHYLVKNNFLKKGYKDENGKMYSHYNYRSLELQSFSIAFSTMLGFKSSTEFIKYIASLDTETVLPEGSAHTALYDCYNQIKFYNGMMIFLKAHEIQSNFLKEQ